ncbi:hypothetical protein D3OALGA1CA_893 [Olavius algarvensis associated proteobacterium Delta 3]|nr:hypothetical protein D3OALGA1CA_893 [Olavius algarvensis associated proteobacterium Delta 3]
MVPIACSTLLQVVLEPIFRRKNRSGDLPGLSHRRNLFHQ